MIAYATELRLSMRRGRPCGYRGMRMPLGDFFGTEIHGSFKVTAFGSALKLSTALRGYGLLAQVRCLVCLVVSPIPNKLCVAAPSAHKQSQLCCVKQSQFYCVGNHEQPRRGESLFASTEQPVYRLSPHLLRRGGFRRGGGASPSRRGRVR